MKLAWGYGEEYEFNNYHQDQLIIGEEFSCSVDLTLDRTSEEHSITDPHWSHYLSRSD